jgi:hypothetical protein
MPFKKGKSGNPSGRPKENHEVRQLARAHSEDAIKRLVFWMRSNNPKASITACLAILNRAWGPPAQESAGESEPERPSRVIHEVQWSGSSGDGTSSSIARGNRSYPSVIDVSAGPSCLPIAAPAKPSRRSTTKSAAR